MAPCVDSGHGRETAYMKVFQWWPYLLLALALAVSVVVYWSLPVVLEGPRGFALNLATEIVGILLTVGLIDAVLRRREEQERERYRSLALRQLWRPLSRHAELLFNIYKASVERKPEREISQVSDLFDEDYFEQVARLDAAADGPGVRGIGGDAVPWYEWINQEAKRFKDDLERVVDKYAMYLDIDTIDAAERLIDSSFISLVGYGPMIVSNSRSIGYQGPIPLLETQGSSSPIREYTKAFSELVDIYNKTAPSDRKTDPARFMWRDDVSPKIGSARIPDGALHDTAGEGSEGLNGTGEQAGQNAD